MQPAPTRVEAERRRSHEAPIDLNSFSHRLDQAINYIKENNSVPILEEPTNQQIATLIENNPNVFIDAMPGTGKTVGVLQIMKTLLKLNPTKAPRLLVTEPRQNAVEKQASFLGGLVDSDNPQRYVDYHHGDRPMGQSGPRNIEFTVEMSLLNELLRDPDLNNYDAVMVDEVHGIKLRLLLPLLRKAQERRKKSNNPLKLIFATGTADVVKGPVTQYFPETKSIKVEKLPHPLSKHWESATIPNKEIAKAAARKALELLKKPDNKGDVLSFLPGQREINEAVEEFQRLVAAQGLNLDVFSMRGGAEAQRNQEIISQIISKTRTNAGAIFVTNVAEESLTIDTVNKVIVSGRRVVKKRDPQTGIYYYERDWITKSSEGQQGGRGNRKGKGDVYYQYARSQQLSTETDDYENIEDDILMLKLATEGEDESSLEFVTPLDKQEKEKAEKNLQKLGILNAQGKIINRKMVETMRGYEVDIHYARMLYEAEQNGERDAVSILIGILNSGSAVFNSDFKWTDELRAELEVANAKSDGVVMLRLWNKYIKGETLPPGINTKVFDDAIRFRRSLFRKNTGEEKPFFNLDAKTTDGQQRIKKIETAVLAGLKDQILEREIEQYRFTNGSSRKINMDPNSIFKTRATKPKRIVSAQLTLNRQANKQEIFATFNQDVDEDLPLESTPPSPETPTSQQSTTESPTAQTTPEAENQKEEQNAMQEIQQELARATRPEPISEPSTPTQTRTSIRTPEPFIPTPPPNLFTRIRYTWHRVWDWLRNLFRRTQ